MPTRHNTTKNFFSGTVTAADIDRGIRQGRRLRADVMRGALEKLRMNFSRNP